MTGLFGSLNTATSGLRAQQVGLQTTSHNLANANTVGYSRQRVTLEANTPQSYAGIGQIGTGVLLNGITRVTDDFVTSQLQNEQAALNRFQQESDIIGQLESVYNEPSTSGLGHQMSELFVSWGNLGANPESITSKTMVIRQTETFLDTVNHATNKMDDLAGETLRLIEKDVLDFNDLSKQLKDVQDHIFNATVKGEMPNDLLDKQDMIIGQMKGIAGVQVDSSDKYGRQFVKLGEEYIVSENEVKELAMVKVDTTIDGKAVKTGTIGIKTHEDDAKIEITVSFEMKSGSIKGIQDGRDVVLAKREELTGFVDQLATAINIIHSDDNLTDTNKLIFTQLDNGQYEVNDILLKDPSQLVTGKLLDKSAAGDGSRAKAIADLQQVSLGKDFSTTYQKETMSFENNASGSTLFNKYNDIVTDMGITKQQADNMVANQTDLTALLEQRQASVAGVDLNEEVVNMIQYQSAFQANSRVISTLAEMLDTLINRTGV